VILPDATSLLDYMTSLATSLASGLVVDTERLRSNLDATSGALFSQRALTALVESGMERDEAYRTVQAAAQEAFDSGTAFRDLIGSAAPELDLEVVFDYDAYLTHLPVVFERLESLRT
jgi:adenylosuccinate lyase